MEREVQYLMLEQGLPDTALGGYLISYTDIYGNRDASEASLEKSAKTGKRRQEDQLRPGLGL